MFLMEKSVIKLFFCIMGCIEHVGVTLSNDGYTTQALSTNIYIAICIVMADPQYILYTMFFICSRWRLFSLVNTPLLLSQIDWEIHLILILLSNSCSGIFEVNCSKDIKIQGIIGPCASLDKVNLKPLNKFL